MSTEEISIVHYEEAYASDYKILNLAWIEKYFIVEKHDLEQLNNPSEYIIDQGGYILFATYNNTIVGTCALIKTGDKEYEMAKMAVAEDSQGKQIGNKLGQAIINLAKELNADRIWLESNRRLIPALTLYSKLGFVEIPMTGSPYARADIRMALWLNARATFQRNKEQGVQECDATKA